MTQTDSFRDWEGWELWYFGSDYLRTTELPPDHWHLGPERPPEPHLWVVMSRASHMAEQTEHAALVGAWPAGVAAAQARAA